MRFLIDCRYTKPQHHDGISRYTVQLISALVPLARAAGHELVMLISDKQQLLVLPDLPWKLVNAPTSIKELTIALRLNVFAADALFSPMQTIGSWGRKYGLVLTLHDLIYYRYRTPPAGFSWVVRALWRLYHLAWWPARILLNRADEVVTVSNTTRDQIRRHRLTKRRVSVVSNASEVVDHRVRDSSKGRDLVYMGTFMPYKNVETLLRALHDLPGYRLHLTSKISAILRKKFLSLSPAGSLVVHDGVSEQKYRNLLDNAFALVTVSFDEGFGLPVVEAMSRGTPVVVSDIPIFREVGGEAPVYVNPHSEADLARAVKSLEQTGEWVRRSVQARVEASRFNWAYSAGELLEVLNRVGRSRLPEVSIPRTDLDMMR